MLQLFIVYTDNYGCYYKNFVLADNAAEAAAIVEHKLNEEFPSPYSYMSDEEREQCYKQAGLEIPEEIRNGSKPKFKVTHVEPTTTHGIIHSIPYMY